MVIVNYIVCDVAKSRRISAKKEYKLLNRKAGKVGMRKLIIVLIMSAIIIFLTGCAKVKDENGEYVNSMFGLIEIEEEHQKQLLYDPETKVVYMYVYDTHRAGISPYYIIGENEKPEIAMYGVNYKKGQ